MITRIFAKPVVDFTASSRSWAEFASWDCSLTDRMTGKIFLRIWSVHVFVAIFQGIISKPYFYFHSCKMHIYLQDMAK